MADNLPTSEAPAFENFRPASLAFIIACHIGLHLQVHLYCSYVRSKPPLMVSLTDLVNLDLARMTLLSGTFLEACYVPVVLDVGMPPSAASVLFFLMRVTVMAVILYLIIGVVVQYLLVHFKLTTLTETLTDEIVQARIRSVVLATSFALNIWILASSTSRSQLLSLMMREAPLEEEEEPSVAGLLTMLVLGMTCAATNLVLRLLMCIQRSNSLLPPPESQPQQAHIPFSVYIAASLFFVVIFVTLLMMHPHQDNTDVPMAVGMFIWCILLPMIFTSSNKKTRTFVSKKLAQALTHQPGKCLNQVSPA